MLAIRPDSWDFPLMLHVAGAMVLVGSLVLAAICLIQAWRAKEPAEAAALIRFGFRTMLFAVLPAYLVMHGAAEWIASREHVDDNNPPSWIDWGYSTADGGGILLLISIILTGIASRRAGRAPSLAGGLVKVGAVLALIVLIAFGVAIWAMTTKPV